MQGLLAILFVPHVKLMYSWTMVSKYALLDCYDVYAGNYQGNNGGAVLELMH